MDNARILSVFKRYDLNGNGKIEPAEFKTVLQGLDEVYWSDACVDNLFSAIDTGEDGLIDVEEMMAWLYDKPGHKLFEVDDMAALKLNQLLQRVSRWTYTEGDYGKSEYDDDWSIKSTCLELTPDLTFTLSNSEHGNSASSFGAGYKYRRSETYRGHCGMFFLVGDGEFKLSLGPDTVYTHYNKEPHASDPPIKLDKTDACTSGIFVVVVSMQHAIMLEVPTKASLHGTRWSTLEGRLTDASERTEEVAAELKASAAS